MAPKNPPHWDLTNVYPSLSSPQYAADFKKMQSLLVEQEKYLAEKVSKVDADATESLIAETAAVLIERFNQILLLAGTLRSYLESFISTDSYNKEAQKKLSEYELASVKTDQVFMQARAWLGKVAAKLPEALKLNETVKAHAFFVKEAANQSKYLMSTAEETLASELNLSGANGWEKLQGTVTSQLSVDFELDGKVQKLPMPALINMRSHPDEEVRRRGYEAETLAWPTVKESLAAAMNGIKGEVNTLNRHRGRKDAVHSSIDIARLDRETLETMLEAMQDSFPMFRKYFKAKAARFGAKQLQWYNLFAPSGEAKSSYSYEEACSFILDRFNEFSPDLGGFAKHAIEHNWIDAEQRDGKRGGAFCMDVPGVGECRILSNFDGSLDQVSTLAHELGHGFHNDCMVKAGKTELQ